MRGTTRAALAACVLTALVGPAAPSAAKNLCGRILYADPEFYVLEKVSTKPGAHGAVKGYFVRESDGKRSPFSGNYALFGTLFEVSVSVGVSSGGFGFGTRQHNFGAPLSDSDSGNDYATEVDGNAGTVTAIMPIPDVVWADCKTAPKFLEPPS